MTARQVFVAGALATTVLAMGDTPGSDERRPRHMTAPVVMESRAGQLSSLRNGGAWINSPPLTATDLRGKVVLIDFWTYTCVNWRRTLPYVRGWASKYKDRGLVVIGVHSPEFPFEKDLENVRREVKTMDIAYPVTLDNDFSIWRRFDNMGWPALYFIDAEGHVRRRQFGEGEYEQAERFIQQLLTEAGKPGIIHDLVAVAPRGAEVGADWTTLNSPETYVRHERIERFASPGGPVLARSHTYAAPARLALNDWALAGSWTMQKGAALLNEASGRIVYRFHARDVNLVMGPAARGTSVRFRVLVDGRPPGVAHGTDVDEQGRGTVAEQRLYQLIRLTAPIVDRQFEIEFLDPGIEAFDLTFG